MPLLDLYLICLHNKPFSLTIGRGEAFTTYPCERCEGSSREAHYHQHRPISRVAGIVWTACRSKGPAFRRCCERPALLQLGVERQGFGNVGVRLTLNICGCFNESEVGPKCLVVAIKKVRVLILKPFVSYVARYRNHRFLRIMIVHHRMPSTDGMQEEPSLMYGNIIIRGLGSDGACRFTIASRIEFFEPRVASGNSFKTQLTGRDGGMAAYLKTPCYIWLLNNGRQFRLLMIYAPH